MTIDNRSSVHIQLIQPPTQLGQRQQASAGKMRESEFPVFAHVHELNVVATGEQRLEFADFDLESFQHPHLAHAL